MGNHFPCGHWHKFPYGSSGGSGGVGDDDPTLHGLVNVLVPVIDMSLSEGDESYTFWSDISFGGWSYYSAGNGASPERIVDDFVDGDDSVELRDIEMQYLELDEGGETA